MARQACVYKVHYIIIWVGGTGVSDFVMSLLDDVRYCIAIDASQSRVADPHSFHPVPAFKAEYRSGFNTDPDPIRIQDFKDQKF